MRILRSLLFIIYGLGLGLILGLFTFLATPYLPLAVNNPILPALGVHKHRIIGFLPYWLVSKATNDYNQEITTLNYFAITLNPDGSLVKLTNPQQEDPGWHDLQTSAVQAKLQAAKNNNLTLSLTVMQQDEDKISALLSDPKQNALNLLADIVPLMKKYQFTDLNLDIESFQPADLDKQQQFLTFVQTIAQNLHSAQLGTVTVDISPVDFVKQYLIDPIRVGQIADFMLVMDYDFHTVLSSNAGPIAPLGGKGLETEYDVTTAMQIAKQEINPNKIIFGIPLYGYEWDTLGNQLGSATIPNTGETASSRRIETLLQTCTTCIVKADFLAQEPDLIYQDKAGDAYFHQIFVFDTTALGKRLSYAQENKFAGVALWALGYESSTLLQPLQAYKSTASF